VQKNKCVYVKSTVQWVITNLYHYTVRHKQVDRLLLYAGWTTAIRFWLALSGVSSQCRMRQHAWSLGLNVTITSPRLLKLSLVINLEENHVQDGGIGVEVIPQCSPPPYLVDLGVPFASAQGRQHLRSASSVYCWYHVAGQLSANKASLSIDNDVETATCFTPLIWSDATDIQRQTKDSSQRHRPLQPWLPWWLRRRI